MADFTPTVNPVDAPSYSGNQYTQGTDKAQLQPLAEVPGLSVRVYTPDYQADKSRGLAARELGNLGEIAANVTDTAIKQNVAATVEDGVNKVRDSFGVAQAAEIADGLPNPTDKSLSDNDQSGGPNRPLALNRIGAQIEGLTEANRQGIFDDQAYYGKLEAKIKFWKQQFPGYEAEIDQNVQRITGTTPANALRNQLIQNAKEINNKLSQQNDKQRSWESEHAADIQIKFPHYFDDKEAGRPVPTWGQLQAGVAVIQANRTMQEAQLKNIALRGAEDKQAGEDAVKIATAKLSDIAGGLVVQSNNAMGLHTIDDINKIIQTRGAEGKTFTPDEQKQINLVMTQLEAQYDIRAKKALSTPSIQGDPTSTVESVVGDSQRIAGMLQQGKKAILDMKQSLNKGEFNLFAADATWNKARLDATESDFIRSNQAAGWVAASRKIYGDPGFQAIMSQNPQLAAMAGQAYRQAGLGAVVTPGNSMMKTFDVFRDNNQYDPKLWAAHTQDAVNTILFSDKLADPTARKDAIEYLFGKNNQTLINSFRASPQSQLVLFNNLISPEMVREAKGWDKNDQSKFYAFADKGFQDVMQQQARQAENASKEWLASKNVAVHWNPKSETFEYIQKGQTPFGQASPAAVDRQPFALDRANASLLPLNAAINNMKHVWKAEGKNATEEVFRILPGVGIYDHSPLYNAIHEQIKSQAEDKLRNAQ